MIHLTIVWETPLYEWVPLELLTLNIVRTKPAVIFSYGTGFPSLALDSVSHHESVLAKPGLLYLPVSPALQAAVCPLSSLVL